MAKLLVLPLSLMIVGAAQADTLNCRLVKANGQMDNYKYTFTEDNGKATVTLSALDNRGNLLRTNKFETLFHTRATEHVSLEGSGKGDTKSLIVADGLAGLLGLLPLAFEVNWTKGSIQVLEEREDGSSWVCL